MTPPANPTVRWRTIGGYTAVPGIPPAAHSSLRTGRLMTRRICRHLTHPSRTCWAKIAYQFPPKHDAGEQRKEGPGHVTDHVLHRLYAVAEQLAKHYVQHNPDSLTCDVP